MKALKRFYKRNTHNWVFRQLGRFGRSLYRISENRNHDILSNGEINVLKKISSFKPKVIIDGGANIGKYSLLVQKYNPTCKIIAFEPVKNTYSKLVENIKSHKNIQPINKGLFSENCSKEIKLFTSSTHSSIYEKQGFDYGSVDRQLIDLVTGDDFLKEQKIESVDFLKLDLEGADYNALVGFRDFLKAGSIKVIQFEYGLMNIESRKLLIDFYELLTPYNYVIGKVYPKSVEFREYSIHQEDFIGSNIVAVHKNEIEAIKCLEKI